MSVLAPPPQDDLELDLLIREARARQRRRRLIGAAVVALVAATGLSLWAAIPVSAVEAPVRAGMRKARRVRASARAASRS
jgi:hypothetical protein